MKLHSLPTTIVSDRDKKFTSSFWQNLFKGLHTQLNLSTTYHPQSDGQTERVNQCLEMFLRYSVAASPTKWAEWLPVAEYWYNTSHHTAIGCSPFKALYGVDPTHGLFPVTVASGSQDADTFLQNRSFMSEFLQQQLARATRRMKQYANNKRSFREFQVGKQVLLKLQPYAQQSVVNRPYPKISFKYFGPFSVLTSMGQWPTNWTCPRVARCTRCFMCLSSRHMSRTIPQSSPNCPLRSKWMWRHWNLKKFWIGV